MKKLHSQKALHSKKSFHAQKRASSQRAASLQNNKKINPHPFSVPFLSRSGEEFASYCQQNQNEMKNEIKQLQIYRNLTTEYKDNKYQILEHYSGYHLKMFYNKIITKENFTLVKFGDGEFRNMISKNEYDHNCDGCNYFEDLGLDLIKAYLYFLQLGMSFDTLCLSHTHHLGFAKCDLHHAVDYF